MNESGRAAGEAMRFYKLTPADVIVIHDELDLKAGTVRVKTGGGNAGHNGLKSLSAYIGNDYKRVRLGIGHPGDKALVVHYVLQDFAKADKEWLEPFLDGIARGMDRLVEGSDAAFLNEAARGRVAAKLNGAAAPAAEKIGKVAPKIEAEPKAAPKPEPAPDKSLEAAVAAAVAVSTPARVAAVTHGGTASGAVARVVILPEHGARSRKTRRACQGASCRSSARGGTCGGARRGSCEGGPGKRGHRAARRCSRANTARAEKEGRAL